MTAKRTTHTTDTVIKRTDNDAPLTRSDIAAIIEADQKSLPSQHSHETICSLPSNQVAGQQQSQQPLQQDSAELASKQHLQQLTQLNTTWQQLNQYIQQQQNSSSTPGESPA